MDLLGWEMFFTLLQERNTVICDKVCEIVLEIVVVMFNFLAIEVEGVVIEPRVPHQPHPLSPAWRDICSIVFIQVLPKKSWKVRT